MNHQTPLQFSEPPLHSTHTQKRTIIFVLGILCTLTPFSIDLYLPAFQEIAQTLHTTIPRVSLSVSTYFIGFALGQLLYGPLLDRFGRKPPLCTGICIYLVATLACMQAGTIESLLVYRFFQAIGGCVAGVAANAMVRDFFPPEEGVKIFSLLMLILAVSPLVAPTFGSLIAVHFGFRAIFATLLLIGAATLALVIFILPKARQADPSFSLKPKAILLNFKSVLCNREFFVHAFAGAFAFAGLFIYVASSPTLFMDEFHLRPEYYGLVFAFLAGGMIGGGQLNLLLLKRYKSVQILKASVFIQAIIGTLFVVTSMLHYLTLTPTILFLFATLTCAGIASPNAAALSLAPFSKNGGTAASLLGFFQLGLGSVASAAVGISGLPASLAIAAGISVTSLCACFISRFAR